MARWHPDIELDAVTITRVIDEQFPHLRAAERGVTRIGAGWDNAVWRVGSESDTDPIAFRFTQRHIGVALAEREVAVMPSIAPLLPLPTSAPIHVGRMTDEVPLPWFGYRLLPGEEAIVADLDATAQTRFASQLGEFLRALHAPDIATAARDAAMLPRDLNRRSDAAHVVDKWRTSLPDLASAGHELTPAQLERLDSISEAAIAAQPPDEDVFLHGDLHVRHLLTDASGSITGVIDWGDMCIGPRYIDLIAYWALLDLPARAAFIEAYGDIDNASLARARSLAVMSVILIAASAADVGRDDVADNAFHVLDRIAAG